MGRKKRPHFFGAVFHVFNRGNNKQDIFRDDADYHRFLRELSCIQQTSGFTLLAFCLMPNHFHLAIRVASIELARIMQPLLGRYAAGFNHRWNRVGHLFQDRFKWKLCLTDAYLIQLAAYIHHNPVEAGLAATAGDWPWSSHGEYLGEPRFADPNTVLSLLGNTRASAIANYLHELEQPPAELEFDGEFDVDESDAINSPTASIETLAQEVSLSAGVSVAALRGSGRSRALAEGRQRLILAAVRAGHQQSDLAAWLGRSRAMISKIVRQVN